MTDVGEVEYHRQAQEFIAPLMHDSSTASDDDLGEVIVQGNAVVTESH